MNNNMEYNIYRDHGSDPHDMYYQSDTPPVFETSAISIISVIIFISFFSTLCGICNRDENDNDNDIISEETINTQLIQQIGEKVSEYKVNEKGDEYCSICLEEFKEKEKIITLECDHYYHRTCITDWLKKEPTCPLCRDRF